MRQTSGFIAEPDVRTGHLDVLDDAVVAVDAGAPRDDAVAPAEDRRHGTRQRHGLALPDPASMSSRS